VLLAMLLAVSAGPAAGWADGASPANPVLDRLLAELKGAPDEQTAQMLELRIHEQWRDQGSPAAKLLLEQGVQELQNKAPDAATEDLSAALDLEPGYAEAYSDRAAAEFTNGQYDAAIRDAGQALRLEPRHFDALRILSHVAEERHDRKAALEAWQKAMSLSPMTPDGQERLNELRRDAEGEAT
jgi:tetratricopeptide (TPR) repeat protein